MKFLNLHQKTLLLSSFIQHQIYHNFCPILSPHPLPFRVVFFPRNQQNFIYIHKTDGVMIVKTKKLKSQCVPISVENHKERLGMGFFPVYVCVFVKKKYFLNVSYRDQMLQLNKLKTVYLYIHTFCFFMTNLHQPKMKI